MTEWFFEIRSGEIPAMMQKPAAEQLQAILVATLTENRLSWFDIKTFVTPTRLGAWVTGLPPNQSETRIERRGPRVDAPQAAIDGFIESTGAELGGLEKRSTDKGVFYFHGTTAPGRSTIDVLPGVLKHVISNFSWPKSMTWNWGDVRWVRPITGGCSVFDGEPVEINVAINAQQSQDIIFNNETVGHRFLGDSAIIAQWFEDYQNKLRANKIIVDPNERSHLIEEGIKNVCQHHRLYLDHDAALLEEVTGLVEYPHVYLGKIDPQFMALPPIVLKTAMRVHQRYFSLKDQQFNIAPYFIVVANIPGYDGGATIIAGNERVLRARLSDAQFFYEGDMKVSLHDHAQHLDKLTFHRKLGSLADKNRRMIQLAELLGLKQNIQGRLTQLITIAKGDLVTAMVKEFPELQGKMGAHYAQHHPDTCNFHGDVYKAIKTQYQHDSLEEDNGLGKLYNLIDRIDTLVGFFLIGIKPTGSKDPFALRRAMTTVIRILESISPAHYEKKIGKSVTDFTFKNLIEKSKLVYKQNFTSDIDENNLAVLKDFYLERLKNYWIEQGNKADHITAVIAIDGRENYFDGNLYTCKKKLTGLKKFYNDDYVDYLALIATYKRVNNIYAHNLTIIKSIVLNDVEFNATHELEAKLYDQWFGTSLDSSIAWLQQYLENDCYLGWLGVMALSCTDINTFFDELMIMSDDMTERNNRLKIVAKIYENMTQIINLGALKIGDSSVEYGPDGKNDDDN